MRIFRYPTRDALVEQLLEYAIDNKIDLTLKLESGRDARIYEESTDLQQFSLKAPESPNKSLASPISNRITTVPTGRLGNRVGQFNKPNLNSERFVKPPKKLKNFFGKRNFELNGEVLGLMSRYTSTDVKIKLVKLAKVINNWRENNFFMEDLFGTDMHHVDFGSNGLSAMAVKNIKQKKLKQRTLAIHLANYSSNNHDEFRHFTKREIEIFISIADCDDLQTVNVCAIALSNICREERVRKFLIEMNAVHKITSMVPTFQTPNVLRAAALLMYYLSCEREIEDRIYSGAFAMVQTNCNSSELESRYLAMHTLNNLLPCAERHRVCDLSIATMQSHKMILEEDETKYQEIIDMIMNMTLFTNLHCLMLDCDVLEMVAQAASKAARNHDNTKGLLLMKILNNFLFNSDVSTALIQQDYIPILIDVLGISNTEIYRCGFRILATVCGRPEFDLSVFDSDVLAVINGIVFNEKLEDDTACDAANFLASLSSVENKLHARRLMSDGVPSALCEFLSRKYCTSVKVLSVNGLMNFFSWKEIASKFVDTVIEPVLDLLRETGCVEAANCIFNLMRFDNCELKLITLNVHVTLLDIMCAMNAKMSDAKSACLRALCRFSSNEQCIFAWLDADLIPRLSDQIALTDKSTWLDISKMILSILARKAEISDVNRSGIEKILMNTCRKGVTSESVLVQSCNIIAFLSYETENFTELDPILRIIVSMSDSEEIIESASVALYNVSCNPNISPILLKDESYLNLMIRMMRVGRASVQVTMGETFRNLCKLSECIKLLLGGRGDIISDFIAIALLRTSSTEVKIVCMQAFFNIFCHNDVRLQLLKGDLWWSMMRLARTDIKPVQHIGASALFQLCIAGHLYGEILRDLHIFNFIRDIISMSDEDLMGRYMLSIEYLLCEFANLQQAELVSVLEASCHCMRYSSKKNVIAGAIRASVKCAVSFETGSEMEFVKHDIIACLEVSKSLWRDEAESVLSLAIILRYLTSFEAFSKAIRLIDLDALMLMILKGSLDEHDLSDVEECIVAVMLNHLNFATTGINDIVSSNAWHFIVENILYSTQKKVSHELHGAVVSICAVHFEEISSLKLFTTVQFYSTIMHTNVSPSEETMMNFLHIVAICSYNEGLSEKIIDAGVIEFMCKYLIEDSGIHTRDPKHHHQKFCSSMLRNFTLHPSCVIKVVNSKNVLDMMLLIVRNSQRKDVLIDICSVLYRTLSVDIVDNRKAPEGLSHTDICNICDCLLTATEKQVVHMAKFISGMTLDKYVLDTGCKPREVCSMYTEMNDKDSSGIPNVLEKMTINELKGFEPIRIRNDQVLSLTCLHAIRNINFSKPRISDARWLFHVSTNSRYLEVAMKSLDNPDPLKRHQFRPTDPFPMPPFYKTIKNYDVVHLQKDDLRKEDRNEGEKEFTVTQLDLERHEVNICQTCEERIAVFRCLNCAMNVHLYCGNCLIAHNQNVEYSQHTLREIGPDYESSELLYNSNEEGDNTYDIPASLAQEFSPAELQLFKHHFSEIDKDKGGTIDCSELQDLTESLGKRVTPKEAKELINQFDADTNGCIDFGEFLMMMNAMKKGSAVVENNALIAAIYKHQIILVKQRASSNRQSTIDNAIANTDRGSEDS